MAAFDGRPDRPAGTGGGGYLSSPITILGGPPISMSGTLDSPRAMQCFRSFHTAERTLEGVEALHMMRKGQVNRLDGRDTIEQSKFVESLFGVAA
jgi:hypothetical protein